jgi:hypothetical protein
MPKHMFGNNPIDDFRVEDGTASLSRSSPTGRFWVISDPLMSYSVDLPENGECWRSIVKSTFMSAEVLSTSLTVATTEVAAGGYDP